MTLYIWFSLGAGDYFEAIGVRYFHNLHFDKKSSHLILHQQSTYHVHFTSITYVDIMLKIKSANPFKSFKSFNGAARDWS